MVYLKFGVVVFVVFYTWRAFAENNSGDTLEGCLARTMEERLNCESGCGLILQVCYDEEISGVAEKSDALQSKITSKSDGACSALASEYVREAKRMEGNIYKKAEILPGWIASDLYVNFVRQRLENLRAIEKGCE